jgi:hypothetical protein
VEFVLSEAIQTFKKGQTFYVHDIQRNVPQTKPVVKPMTEEEPIDINEVEQMIDFLKKSSDATLMLNLITPYLVSDKKTKLSKTHQDLIEVIQMLIVNQMKMQNDMRSILLYLNKKEMLSEDHADLPDLKATKEDSGIKDAAPYYC